MDAHSTDFGLRIQINMMRCSVVRVSNEAVTSRRRRMLFRRRYRIVTPSPHTVCTILQGIWNMEMEPDLLLFFRKLGYGATDLLVYSMIIEDIVYNAETGAENFKRMGQDIVQDSIWEQDDDSEEDQEEDGDDEDTFDM
ncbi:hypothetical protein Tco_0876957 [Tanacetum coccineum]|uniref:Uncharacterized protein n=1 Tax=Tanacetum coccineum TaxID=301880 RepID=A0ABQ5BU00_9ASTR